jgi:hypothetical protein
MAGAKNHQYHILPPSIWPLFGAFSALVLASGGIMWMHKMPSANLVFFAGVAGGDHDFRLVVEGDRRGACRRSHPDRPASPALRHDPVHRLRSDVLRRLVLGVVRFLALPLDGGRRRRRLAAQGHGSAQRLAVPAAQHADPALLGLHRDLGAPRAAARRPRRAEEGPVADDHPRHLVQLLPGVRVYGGSVPLQGGERRRIELWRRLLHGDRLPRLPRHGRHDLPDREPDPRL